MQRELRQRLAGESHGDAGGRVRVLGLGRWHLRGDDYVPGGCLSGAERDGHVYGCELHVDRDGDGQRKRHGDELALRNQLPKHLQRELRQRNASDADGGGERGQRVHGMERRRLQRDGNLYGDDECGGNRYGELHADVCVDGDGSRDGEWDGDEHALGDLVSEHVFGEFREWDDGDADGDARKREYVCGMGRSLQRDGDVHDHDERGDGAANGDSDV